MVRDMCSNGYPTKETPNFEVTGDFKRYLDTKYSMVESVNIRFYKERKLVSKM